MLFKKNLKIVVDFKKISCYTVNKFKIFLN